MKATVKLQDLPVFCQQLAARFSKRQLVLLSGPLGAGKTQFVKSCVQVMGGEMPDSPTFSLINEYSGTKTSVWHVDLYRLSSEADIDSTGFWDLFREQEGVIFVEWPEQVESSSWPLNWPQLHIDLAFTQKEGEREFQVS